MSTAVRTSNSTSILVCFGVLAMYRHVFLLVRDIFLGDSKQSNLRIRSSKYRPMYNNFNELCIILSSPNSLEDIHGQKIEKTFQISRDVAGTATKPKLRRSIM
jgi:hypothetical protein